MTPSTGMVSPGATRRMSPTATASAGMTSSPPAGVRRRAVRGVRWTSFSMHGQIFEQAAELHDESDLARGKVLADSDRGQERNGHEHIGLDVKGRDQANNRLQDDRDAAQDDGNPGRVKRQRDQIKDAHEQRYARHGQAGDLAPGAAPCKQGFQFFHWVVPPFCIPPRVCFHYTHRGIPMSSEAGGFRQKKIHPASGGGYCLASRYIMLANRSTALVKFAMV